MSTAPWVRRRRRLLLASALPVLLVLLLALKLLSLPVLTSSAGGAHESGDGAGVRTAGERLGVVNIVQRWRAPYVEGTGRAMGGDLEGGRRDLELALGRTGNPQDDCTVRTNLVLTIERQSDAAGEAGDTEGEKKIAEEALALIEAGPEGCLDGSADGNGGEAGQKQQESKQRLEEKTQPEEGDGEEEEQDPSKDDSEGEGEDPQKDEKQKQLEEKNKAGQGDAETKKKIDEAEESNGGDYAEKPW